MIFRPRIKPLTLKSFWKSFTADWGTVRLSMAFNGSTHYTIATQLDSLTSIKWKWLPNNWAKPWLKKISSKWCTILTSSTKLSPIKALHSKNFTKLSLGKSIDRFFFCLSHLSFVFIPKKYNKKNRIKCDTKCKIRYRRAFFLGLEREFESSLRTILHPFRPKVCGRRLRPSTSLVLQRFLFLWQLVC